MAVPTFVLVFQIETIFNGVDLNMASLNETRISRKYVTKIVQTAGKSVRYPTQF